MLGSVQAPRRPHGNCAICAGRQHLQLWRRPSAARERPGRSREGESRAPGLGLRPGPGDAAEGPAGFARVCMPSLPLPGCVTPAGTLGCQALVPSHKEWG